MITSSTPSLEPLVVTKKRAALMLSVSPSMIDALLRRGELRGVRLGRRRLIATDELRELVARKRGEHE